VADKLIGQNYTTPDLVAKVTGKAKYAEDFKADGMLFAKLLLSPMPHARVISVDTSAAEAMPGVKAILRYSELPGVVAGQTLGEGVVSTAQGEQPLTDEPVYEGEPILAVAAVDEYTAAEAIEKIQIEFEPLPFAVDPLVSLRPGGPNARLQGNAWITPAPAAGGGAGRGGPAAAAAAGGPAAAAAGGGAAATPRGGAPAAGAPAPANPPAATLNSAPAAANAAPAAAAGEPQAGRGQGRQGGSRGAGRGEGTADGRGRGRGEGQAAAGAAAGTAAGAQAQGRGGAEGRGAAEGRGGRGAAGGGPPAGPQIQELKWTDADFAAAEEGQLPLGKHATEWMFGDVEAALKEADLVLDETFVGSSTGHQPLETRTAMAYWQGDKLFIHCSTQSTVQTVAAVMRGVGMDPQQDADKLVLISEYTGGGFGSKIPGSINMAIPALLSKKVNGAPVQLRVTREEEHYIGRARPALTSRVKVGFRKDGKILAIDGFAIADNGPYNSQGDAGSAGSTISLCYQPTAMRWRTINVLTNTPPKTSQRAPGGMQGNGLIEPVITKAANKLGIDQVEIRKINAPAGKAPFGPPAAGGRRNYVTSAFVKEALEKGAEVFNWQEKKARSGKRIGTKVRGAGVAVSAYTAGSTGFDGLLVIRPDGKVQIQSGIGNLGTHSVIDVHRVAAEVLGVAWDQCEVVWGNTSKHLPWTCISAGSQTTHAMTRAAHAVGMEAKKRLQEVAAKAFGGNPASYQVANGRVSGAGRSMTFAQAAQKAIELGGIYDGHEAPEGINAFTRRSVAGLAGQGLVVAARDTYPRDGATQSYVAGFAEVEVDVETGAYHIVDFAAVADVGTVLNPRSLQGQTFGGVMLGIGHAIGQKWVYDQHYGVPLAKRFYHNKPPTIMDAPTNFSFAALNLPDPETPVGARGVGEPPVGAGLAAVLNALAAAVGDEIFRRSPVNADMILTSLEAGRRVTEPLTAHI
jgi:CO/xanthine dehydrogenase Mo-binding subunit